MIFDNNYLNSTDFDWNQNSCQSELQMKLNSAMVQRLASIEDICDLVFGLLIQYCPRPGGSDYANARRPGWRNNYSTGSLVSTIRYAILNDYTFEFTIGGGTVDYASYTSECPNTKGGHDNPNYQWVETAMNQAKEVIEESYGGVNLDLTI